MDSKTPESGYLRQAWLVILLGLLYGGALAGVQTSLGPRIEANLRAETLRAVPGIVPGAEAAQTTEHTIVGRDGRRRRVYRAYTPEGTPAGWVLPASGLGFADRIDLLVGLDPALNTITGIYVLDQRETPGLGNFIAAEEFRGQFEGKSAAAPLRVVKHAPAAGRNEVRAVSGATMSSESVAHIINAAIENLREPLREL